MERRFKGRRVKLAALWVAGSVASVLVSPTASALEIIVAKDNPTSAPAKYTRSGNSCTKTVLTADPRSGWYSALGTNFADQIYVFDSGPNINWCGFNIAPLAPIPSGKRLLVAGLFGADIIYGGNGDGAAKVDDIYGSSLFGWSDGAADAIWAGSASRVVGSAVHFEGNNVFLLPKAGVLAEGADGQDLFCTQVTNVFSNPGVAKIDGNDNTDFRYGPSGIIEVDIEQCGGNFNRDRCDLAFLAFIGTFQDMINV